MAHNSHDSDVERTEHGNYAVKYPDADFIDTLRGPVPQSTVDVALALGCTRVTAYNRLKALDDEGEVQSKKIGGGGRVWWVDEKAVGQVCASCGLFWTGREFTRCPGCGAEVADA